MDGRFRIVRVKTCVASGPDPLCAVKVRMSTSPVLEPEIPASVAVPLPLSVKVNPPGTIPVSLSEGAGKPDVVTVKEPVVLI